MKKSPRIYPPGTVIDKYTIRQHVGHGGYGETYSVTKNGEDDDQLYAMKTENKKAAKSAIYEEIEFLMSIQDCPYFPHIIETGETPDLKWLVMELLGPSLAQLCRVLPNQSLSKYTATYIGKHMLKAIEECHKHGIIHRDIKPANFLVRPNRDYPICLIDFGLSRSYCDENGVPYPPRKHPGFVGTCSFASPAAHKGEELSKKDDIISLIYTIICVVDRLPWPGTKNREKTKEMKENMPPESLFKRTPKQFLTIFNMVSALSFYDEPDYQEYYRLLDEALNEISGKKNHLLDWEKLSSHTISKISAIPLKIKTVKNKQKPPTHQPEESHKESEEMDKESEYIDEYSKEKVKYEKDEKRDSDHKNKKKKKKKKKESEYEYEVRCFFCNIS